MAIAYRASSTPQHLAGSASPHSVNLPAGHVANDTLLLFSLTDDNNGTTSTPAGWTKLGEWAPGSTTGFLVYARLEIFWRTDTGSLGSTVSVSYSADAWPNGDASVLVWTTAYSGCDTVAPIETLDQTSTTSTAAAQLHPQLTTTAANCWLLTMRAGYSNTARTFTASGGTNSERIDDNFTNIHAALYDSNGALSAGLQTQRTTTASGTMTGGGTMVSISLKPAPVAGSAVASPTTAEGTGTALNASVSTVRTGWGLCTDDAPDYQFHIDWSNDGTYDLGEEVTSDIITDVSVAYGRDQERQFSPASVGNAAFDLVNVGREFSPENSSSPLFGDLDPARPARFQVVWGGETYPLFQGRIDDFDIKADRADRSVGFTFLDGLSQLQGVQLSTSVYFTNRTGTLIDEILNLVGWTAGRDIDPGATVVQYWWEEGTDALEAVQKLVRSEGPPAIAYVGPDGTFVFRDRHHRLLRDHSIEVQASFAAREVSCDAPAVTGLDYTAPFVYSNGWRDITNTVTFNVDQRSPDGQLTDVWTSESAVELSIGQTATIDISTSDPFIDAQHPVNGTDYVATGAGTAQVFIDRTSGASTKIYIYAVGGAVRVSGLRLRARSLAVRRQIRVTQIDADSITKHGERAYPQDAPWANIHDAAAIANMILLHYATRRPTIQLRVAAEDPEHLGHILSRTISDRIHVRNDELGLDSDFFVEKVTHTLQRFNRTGKPPVHSVVLGCERDIQHVTNPFTFDLRDAGFNDGVFDPVKFDDPDTVFIFDDSDQGRFDIGMFGT